MLTAIREQIEQIVWSLFYWQGGEVTFAVGELRERDLVQIQLPIGQVILRGILQAPDAKLLVTRMGSRETVMESCYRVEDLVDRAVGGTNSLRCQASNRRHVACPSSLLVA